MACVCWEANMEGEAGEWRAAQQASRQLGRRQRFGARVGAAPRPETWRSSNAVQLGGGAHMCSQFARRLRCAVQCAGSHGLPHRTPRFGSASCCPLSYIATRSQTRVHVPLLCLLPRHAAAQPHHALHPLPSLAPAARSRTAPRRPRLTRRCRRRRCAAARGALLALTVPMACLIVVRRQAVHRLPLWQARADEVAMQLQ